MKIESTARCALFLWSAALLCMGQITEQEQYWLIKDCKGRWEYRPSSAAPRTIADYDCLRPTGEVRCLEADVRRCELWYLVDGRANKVERLALRGLRTGRWVSLKTLTPPTPALSPPTPEKLVEKFSRITQRGGSRTGTACGGDLSLKAPACGETIDVEDFKILWTDKGEEPDKKLAIIVERVDGPQSLFRGTIAAIKGVYADDKLLDFLKKLQGRNDLVDITVSVMAENGRSAIRLVHIPPSVRTGAYQSRMREIESSDPLWRTVQAMSLATDEGMWSKAAEEANRLMELAPHVRDFQEYALAGLCQSDFVDDKLRLRGELPKETYDHLCSLMPSPDSAPASTSAPDLSVARIAAQKQSGTRRLGIALLIGNSEYWNLPLNSVKSDIKYMGEMLNLLGFQVWTRENLKDPNQFREALQSFLVTANASPEDVLLVYYSGHGLQLDGKAQLLGTGVSQSARAAEDVRSNAESAETIVAEMERAVPGTRILIVEACRNNVFATASQAGGQIPRGGFAFQQDDVPNTIVMFANKPGLPTPSRSDFGLMGPFTEALIHALGNSSGEIQEVFASAAKKTAEISPGQEAVIYTSKRVERIVLRPQEGKPQTNRAAELLNGAAVFYSARAWDQFMAVIERARAIAITPTLQERLSHEAEFVALVTSAEKQESKRDWKGAAEAWQKARAIFPARRWLSMKAAIASLMADDLVTAVRVLSLLGSEKEGELAEQAHQLTKALVATYPTLQAETSSIPTATIVVPEFELVSVAESVK